MNTEFVCATCGLVHEGWPAIGYEWPSHYGLLSEEKKSLSKLDDDICIIASNNETQRFIRTVFIQKVIDNCQALEYGLWVSLSKESFEDYTQHFGDPFHEARYFGWLSTFLPQYDLEAIPMNVNAQQGNKRPIIQPHATFEHPLVADFYNGIPLAEAEERIEKAFNNSN